MSAAADLANADRSGPCSKVTVDVEVICGNRSPGECFVCYAAARDNDIHRIIHTATPEHPAGLVWLLNGTAAAVLPVDVDAIIVSAASRVGYLNDARKSIRSIGLLDNPYSTAPAKLICTDGDRPAWK